MTCFLCGPFQGCCLKNDNNRRAAVFSMRSVPTTIGKPFILYRPMVNSVAVQCNNNAAVFSLWSDHRLYNKDKNWDLFVIGCKLVLDSVL
jgi:hypothetical protein